jgi:3-hydroxyacyl-CoA dehydrogenase
VSSINRVAELTIDGNVATVTMKSPPVNALSQLVRDGLKRGVEAAEADPAVKATVIICAGRTFIAGADISEFGKPPAAPYLPDVLDTIENASKPVVAALHGTALGGGFEVALTAHYPIAVPSAKCGLPKIKLGLLPAPAERSACRGSSASRRRSTSFPPERPWRARGEGMEGCRRARRGRQAA